MHKVSHRRATFGAPDSVLGFERNFLETQPIERKCSVKVNSTGFDNRRQQVSHYRLAGCVQNWWPQCSINNMASNDHKKTPTKSTCQPRNGACSFQTHFDFPRQLDMQFNAPDPIILPMAALLHFQVRGIGWGVHIGSPAAISHRLGCSGENKYHWYNDTEFLGFLPLQLR